MILSQIKIILILVLFFQLIPETSSAKITEKELKKCSSSFLLKVISDNPDSETIIRECLNGIVRDDKAGIRLIDKFGLFAYDSKKHGVAIKKIKFFHRVGVCYFFIVLEDSTDDETYTLYLEYEFEKVKRLCHLRDVYFSFVFKEKMKVIENFFRSR